MNAPRTEFSVGTGVQGALLAKVVSSLFIRVLPGVSGHPSVEPTTVRRGLLRRQGTRARHNGIWPDRAGDPAEDPPAVVAQERVIALSE